MGPAGDYTALKIDRDPNSRKTNLGMTARKIPFIASGTGLVVVSVVSAYICIWRHKATEQDCRKNCIEK